MEIDGNPIRNIRQLSIVAHQSHLIQAPRFPFTNRYQAYTNYAANASSSFSIPILSSEPVSSSIVDSIATGVTVPVVHHLTGGNGVHSNIQAPNPVVNPLKSSVFTKPTHPFSSVAQSGRSFIVRIIGLRERVHAWNEFTGYGTGCTSGGVCRSRLRGMSSSTLLRAYAKDSRPGENNQQVRLREVSPHPGLVKLLTTYGASVRDWSSRKNGIGAGPAGISQLSSLELGEVRGVWRWCTENFPSKREESEERKSLTARRPTDMVPLAKGAPSLHYCRWTAAEGYIGHGVGFEEVYSGCPICFSGEI
ncbi:uncharacterized protein EV422DRAFT_503843 [Fimicolochytrium jonesii]|uniref:uncharacterized protein n=1 Tax=Fimicolochytrium jonesii TaxID=1396493 RepID=UPI0022FF2D54|nr:uncharacterized protein EV422DRAFT_503843 [Fimicolochytrium jonesii]KAI8825078.1 hypothetical protein EV422DRAFT_503843 [Fimicolochytrium jonesii]